ncbi:hypothetical protein A6A40_23600 (plasmid) [Azospirillum humicireducens]|uniref:Uncharacterized protein n=1 Tax=Azospirillum humicireducens TaxID=1226968 RepID=A0A2R4VUB4_9PROT|nr:phosphotransferase [Azospirillum humicireducens]AWB08036.1 hypothetical protein A6A40_23600 [Azospirillum humicireducens]
MSGKAVDGTAAAHADTAATGLALPDDDGRLILVKELHGHSGCRLLLLRERDCDAYRVRKISGSAGYDSRLRDQRHKQCEMAALGLPCPAVLKEGLLDGGDLAGRYCFDMEYVQGQNLGDVLEHGDSALFDTVAGSLAATLRGLAATTSGCLPPGLFLDKIAAIAATIPPCLESGRDPGRMREAISETATHLAAQDWSGIPASQGHGDMTVENVLRRPDGTLCFIDFLDGPLNSCWLDVAKLHQDLQGHWFLRNLPDEQRSGPRGRGLRIAAAKLAALLHSRLHPLWPDLHGRLRVLTQFQLFRIVPYCRSDEILSFVLQRIRDIDKDATFP